MSFLDHCRKFISIDSSTSHGTEELANYASQLAESYGLQVELQSSQLNGRVEKNILVTLPGELEEDYLLLQTHLDTSDPGIYALWDKTEHNPFNASIYTDTIYGLGVADAKLDFLCKLEALKSFKEKKLKEPILLAGTFGQQCGMEGAIKLLRKNKKRPKLALVGAPTNLKLVNASSGFATVEITVPFSEEEMQYHKTHDLAVSSSTQSKIFYGKSSHSANSQINENAIMLMLEYIAQLPEGIVVMDMEGGVSYNSVPESAFLELDIVGGFSGSTIVSKFDHIVKGISEISREFEKYPEENFTPSLSTLNVGRVKKHKDHVQFMGCCHIVPSIQQEVYDLWIKRLKSSCEEIGAQFRVMEYKQPFFTSENGDFIKKCQNSLTDIDLDSDLIKISEITEASVFSRLGVECLVFGAGVGAGNSFAPNEKVKIEDLKNSIEFYKNVIQKVCL